MTTEEKDGAKGVEANLAVVEPEGGVKHEEVRRQALALRDKSESSSWELGMVLEEIYKGDLYRDWGFDSWTEYVEQELDVHIRKAQFLVRLQAWFGTMTPAIQKWIKELGWTKARTLMHVVDKTNAAEWRKRVEGKSVVQIEKMIKADRESAQTSSGGGGEDGGEEPVEKARKRSFSVFPEQDEIVTKAIEKASEVAESDKEGNLITLICMDYLANQVDTFTRDDFLKSIEKNLGIKIVALVPRENKDEPDDIVYGSEYFDKDDA